MIRILFSIIIGLFCVQSGSANKSTITVDGDTTVMIIDTICIGQVYVTPEDRVIDTTGIYIDTFQLTLTCDSIRVLDITIVEKAPPVMQSVTYCFDDPNAPPAGTYTIATVGCTRPDTIVEVSINVEQAALTFAPVICEGDSYTWSINNEVYDMSGTYLDTVPDMNGCNQLAVLNLVIEPIPSFPVSDTIICSTTFTDFPVGTTLVTVCDTAYNVTVVDYDPVTVNETVMICEGENYLGYDSTGTYLVEMVTPDGCTDVLVLDLRVMGSLIEVTTEMRVCEGEIGVPDPGTYIDTLVNPIGCDTLNILVVTVFPSTPDIEVDSIECGTNSVPGTYIMTLIDANGCEYESIINLTVFPEAMDATLDTMICEGEEYLGFTETGNYTVPQINQDGCPFDLFLSLEVVPLADCNVSVADNETAQMVTIFPNPSRDFISISTEKENASIQVFDSQGRVILKESKLIRNQLLDVSQWESGVYYFKFTDGDIFSHQKFLKL